MVDRPLMLMPPALVSKPLTWSSIAVLAVRVPPATTVPTPCAAMPLKPIVEGWAGPPPPPPPEAPARSVANSSPVLAAAPATVMLTPSWLKSIVSIPVEPIPDTVTVWLTEPRVIVSWFCPGELVRV
jgi:hypothetical protein